MNNRAEVSAAITKGCRIYAKMVAATLPAVMSAMNGIEEFEDMEMDELPEWRCDVTQVNANTTSILVEAPEHGLVDVHIRIARIEVYE